LKDRLWKARFAFHKRSGIAPPFFYRALKKAASIVVKSTMQTIATGKMDSAENVPLFDTGFLFVRKFIEIIHPQWFSRLEIILLLS